MTSGNLPAARADGLARWARSWRSIAPATSPRTVISSDLSSGAVMAPWAISVFRRASSAASSSFMPSFYLDFTMTGGTGGTLQYVVSGGPLWVMRAGDDFCFNWQSSVGGNGPYLNTSDRRAKTNIAPTTKGLAEVLQLQPVEFDRANAATGAQHEIGRVVQDVQPIVPEAVWTKRVSRCVMSGGLDSADPTLALSGVHPYCAERQRDLGELNALIVALTDRIAALDSGAA